MNLIRIINLKILLNIKLNQNEINIFNLLNLINMQGIYCDGEIYRNNKNQIIFSTGKLNILYFNSDIINNLSYLNDIDYRILTESIEYYVSAITKLKFNGFCMYSFNAALID